MNRRLLLAGALGLPAAMHAGLSTAAAQGGSITAEDFGVRPDRTGDQSRGFSAMLAEASARRVPVCLPAGDFVVSNIRFPDGTQLAGVPGKTRIVHGGGGFLVMAEDCAAIRLHGLTFDGADKPLDEKTQALLDFRRVGDLAVEACTIVGSAKSGLALENVSGFVERCVVSGAAEVAIYSVEAGRMRIANNTILDCADGGILVHRWQSAGDGTLITGNRIERIGARSGGTGQYGNGINVFRADNVIVSGNHVADCAFSAIRANSASNVQIVGNQCLRSGETAIYSEFSFEGAVITSNIVDGAAVGISIANFNEGGRMAVCQGNVVRNLVDKAPYEAFEAIGFGIGIAVEADTAVSGNVIENAPRFGIMLGYGPFLRNVVASGNIVREAGEGVAVSVVEGAGSVIVSDNVLDRVGKGVVGYRWGDAVTGDLVRNADETFPNLTVERNRVS